MNRVRSTFAGLRSENRRALVGYLTAGDPDADTSLRNIRAAIDSGLDVLELGVPFSDATADGPTIQAASQRALAGGMTVDGALAIVRELRRDYDLPIILFGYANPFFTYGYERLATAAADAGVDGFLVVDLPFEESREFREPLATHGLSLIPLIAPTTPVARAAEILREADGFVYYIMVTGVTGARREVRGDVAQHLGALRGCTDLPVVVGFGIANGDQAREAGTGADGVVVGSALVAAALADRLVPLVRELHDALGAD